MVSMEMVRLRWKSQCSSKVEELLESYISQSEVVPKGAYRIREPDSVPREVRKPLIQAAKEGQTWSCRARSEEHTSELQSRSDLVCRLLLEKKKQYTTSPSWPARLNRANIWTGPSIRRRACTTSTLTLRENVGSNSILERPLVCRTASPAAP